MNESMSPAHLHRYTTVCRICMKKPESNNQNNFHNVFSADGREIQLKNKLWSHLGVQISKRDIKPKSICNDCYTAVLLVDEIKKKAHVSQIVLDCLVKENCDARAITPRISATHAINEASTSSINIPTTFSVESTDDSDCQIMTFGDEVILISDSESRDCTNQAETAVTPTLGDVDSESRDCTNQAETAVTSTLGDVQSDAQGTDEKKSLIGEIHEENISEVTHTPTMTKKSTHNSRCEFCGKVFYTARGLACHIKYHFAR